MSCAGMPSVMQMIVATPASADSVIAAAANRGGTNTIAVFAPVSAHGVGDGVEDRHALDVLAGLAGSHARDQVGPVLAVAQPVERALAPGQPLDQQLGVLVDKNAHG